MLRHASGTVSSVHMDMIDRDYSRRSRWIGEHGTIDWSWGSDVVRGSEVLWRHENFDLNETYVAALRDFVAAVQEGRPPRATASDGLRVLEICEAVAAA
jgi:predicted dehydrogenase